MRSKLYLLDTQILLWWLADDKRLNKRVRAAIADPKNIVFISVINLWEIVIKEALGKLQIKYPLEQWIKKIDFEILALKPAHVLQLKKLPNYHHDPFDRVLIAQAICENMVLITADEKIKKYKIRMVES